MPFDDYHRNLYLEHLRQFGQPRRAAKHVGCLYSSVKGAVKNEQSFREAYEDALGLFAESVEEEVRSRAIDGWEEPVFYKGEEIAQVNKKSDGLLTLLVKAKNTEFNDKLKAEVTVTGGLLVTAALPATTEEWIAQQALVAKHQARLAAPGATNDIIDVAGHSEVEDVEPSTS